jgi:hypothetical protein
MYTHAAGFVSMRPRRRAASVPEELRAPIEVTLQALTAHFHMPLYKAASSFGIGVSSLKNVCRRLGLQGWPFQKKGRPRRTPRPSPVLRRSTGPPARPRPSAYLSNPPRQG